MDFVFVLKLIGLGLPKKLMLVRNLNQGEEFMIGRICLVKRFDMEGNVVKEFELKYPMSNEEEDAFRKEYMEHEKWFRNELVKF